MRSQDHVQSSSCDRTCLEASSTATSVVVAMLRDHHFILGGLRLDIASVSMESSESMTFALLSAGLRNHVGIDIPGRLRRTGTPHVEI